jgi:hypothetical protein
MRLLRTLRGTYRSRQSGAGRDKEKVPHAHSDGVEATDRNTPDPLRATAAAKRGLTPDLRRRVQWHFRPSTERSPESRRRTLKKSAEVDWRTTDRVDPSIFM